eukprot:NODE_27157_length_523_cov_2.590909.p5 GENE.NODE_27157_length_523_cov_2.590909~~NODE_27157_length_523_cov_2.590909.p5  ORF type:complete len:56 (+),score=3.07 NODE_27157_length_523_cov_2.590909:293-460(+)
MPMLGSSRLAGHVQWASQPLPLRGDATGVRLPCQHVERRRLCRQGHRHHPEGLFA